MVDLLISIFIYILRYEKVKTTRFNKKKQNKNTKNSHTKTQQQHQNTTIFVWSIINMQDKNTVSYAWMKGNIKVLV